MTQIARLERRIHMPFPQSPRVEFERNPLERVLCQLRFPPILTIATTEPAQFQERIRDKYPVYLRQDQGGFPEGLARLIANAAPGLPEIPGLNVSQPSHTFQKEDAKRSIVLSREFVAVEEKAYRRWEEFVGEVELALDALEGCYRPSFFSRIGLRYRDVIDREALGVGKVRWSELITPGLLAELGTAEVESQVEETSTTTLIRLDEVPGLVRMRHGLANKREGGQVYFVDTDFHLEEKRARTDVRPILDDFNRIAGDLFRWALAPTLRDVLGASEIH